MARFTITDLRVAVKKINEWCAEDGIPFRLIEQGRNGYQAIDEYSTELDGRRIGSGVNRNVCCGTSRECADAAHMWHNEVSARWEKEKNEAKLAAFDDMVSTIDILTAQVAEFRKMV